MINPIVSKRKRSIL